jgi:hypothetical protein
MAAQAANGENMTQMTLIVAIVLIAAIVGFILPVLSAHIRAGFQPALVVDALLIATRAALGMRVLYRRAIRVSACRTALATAVSLTIAATGVQLYASQSGSATVSAGSPAQAITIPRTTADFAIMLQAVFSTGANQGFAFTSGSTQDKDQYAVTVRAIGNIVQARAAAGYPGTGFSITPGTPITFIVTGSVKQRTFSVWMASAGQPAVSIASAFGWRANSQAAALDTLMVWADLGTVTVKLIQGASSCGVSNYDQLVLSDRPVGFWSMSPSGSIEPDLTGNGHDGHYISGLPKAVPMLNGDMAADFDGLTQYLTIESNPRFSVSTTRDLTFELWFRANVADMPKQASDGHVQIMGKCDYDGPRCEWEARRYNATTSEGRAYRVSGYIFNTGGGEGSAADFQPVPGELQPLTWHHIVVEFTTNTTPTDCANPTPYPGGINIWVDGILWNAAAHRDTGCMSQFPITPKATGSPVNIGTMNYTEYFKGAVGKVALYDYLLTPSQITQHFEAMTGRQPTGNCNQPNGYCTLK